MTVLYVETSAVLAWLFSEPGAERAISDMNRADLLVSSELTRIETIRSLKRAFGEGHILEADRGQLVELFLDQISGWFRMNLDESVIMGAIEDLPVEPVRSLDAIHLATALEFRKLYPDLHVISYDKRIRDNCDVLGM